MKLIPDDQLAAIRAAIHDVTDTFADTPVKYYLSKGSIDRFNEDRSNGGKETFQQYNLKALMEFETREQDNIESTMDGAENDQVVKLTFNLDDLDGGTAGHRLSPCG